MKLMKRLTYFKETRRENVDVEEDHQVAMSAQNASHQNWCKFFIQNLYVTNPDI